MALWYPTSVSCIIPSGPHQISVFFNIYIFHYISYGKLPTHIGTYKMLKKYCMYVQCIIWNIERDSPQLNISLNWFIFFRIIDHSTISTYQVNILLCWTLHPNHLVYHTYPLKNYSQQIYKINFHRIWDHLVGLV